MVAPQVGVMDSHMSVWPLELGDGLPRFVVASQIGVMNSRPPAHMPTHVAKSLTLECSFADQNAPFHWLYFAGGFPLHS